MTSSLARVWITCALALAGVAASAAQNDLATKRPPAAVSGEAIYRVNCAVCHGDRGDGKTRVQQGLNPPPRDFTTPQAGEELTRERMMSSVTYGRPGTAMVGFASRLSEAKIAAVVEYIRANFMVPEARKAKLPPALARGADIYMKRCAVCHGDKGNGAVWARTGLNPAPRDFTSLTARSELTQERMVASVTHGRPGTAMMSFKSRLSGKDISEVVGYIRTSFMQGEAAPHQDGKLPDVPNMSRPFPARLKGDRKRGQAIYLSNCFTCHGVNGDGAGPRAFFINPRPRNFLAEDAHLRLNRPALFNAVSNGLSGTVMPAWNKVLSDQQIADVAEYVFTAFIQPGAAGSMNKESSTAARAKKKVSTP